MRLFVNDCQFPGSAASYLIDEQRNGFVLGQKKEKVATADGRTAPPAGPSKRHNRVGPLGKRRLLAPLRHAEPYDECRLSGVKRKQCGHREIVAFDPILTPASLFMLQ